MAKKRNTIVRLVFSATDNVTKVVQGMGRSLTALGKKATSTGALIAGALAGAGIARVFSGAISSAADFERQMVKVGIVTRSSSEELNSLRDAANEAGATTAFTATQAAQALEVLGRSGKSSRESIALLRDTLSLATAEGLDLAESASFITKTLAQFGLGVEEATRITDVLVAGSQRADTDVRQLGLALSYVGLEASDAGLSLEETVALLGKLADVGLQAERGGTGLRNILAQLSKPTTKVRQELAALNITSTNAIEVFEQLAAAGDEGRQVLQAFQLVPSTAAKALQKAAGELGGFVDGLQDVEGVAGDAAAALSQNLIGATTSLSSAWDALRRKLVDPLIEPLTGQINELTKGLRDLSASDDLSFFQEQIKGLVLGTVELFKGIGTAFTGLTVVFNALGGTLDFFQIGINKAAASIQSLNAAADISRLQALESALAKIAEDIGKNSEQYKTVQTEIDRVTARIEANNRAVQSYNDAADAATTGWLDNMEEVNQGLRIIQESLADAGTGAASGLNTTTTAIDKLGQAADQVDIEERVVRPLETLDLTAKETGGSLTALAVDVDDLRQRFAATFDESIQKSADFQKALDGIKFDASVESANAMADAFAIADQAGQQAVETQGQANAAYQEEKLTKQEVNKLNKEALADSKKGIFFISQIVDNWANWNLELKVWAQTIFNAGGLIPITLIGAWLERLEIGKKIIADQTTLMNEWIDSLKTANNVELPGIVDNAERAYKNLSDLNDQTLDQLRQALKEAKQEVAEFADTVEEELFNLTATEAERETRRFEEQLARIKAIGEFDKQRSRELEALAREYHEAELKRIRERNEARGGDDNIGFESSGPSATGGGSGGGNVVPFNTSAGGSVNQQAGGQNVGDTVNVLLLDGTQANELVRFLDDRLERLRRNRL